MIVRELLEKLQALPDKELDRFVIIEVSDQPENSWDLTEAVILDGYPANPHIPDEDFFRLRSDQSRPPCFAEQYSSERV